MEMDNDKKYSLTIYVFKKLYNEGLILKKELTAVNERLIAKYNPKINLILFK